jgi:pimeloyl-ACP methyl ester carboxylesterase
MIDPASERRTFGPSTGRADLGHSDTGAPLTLVLVHGAMSTSVMWDEVMTHLAHRSLAVDLPGRRYKPADLSTVTRADWIRSVCGDIVAADLDDVVLVGHSGAGFVIPGVATQLDGRVRGMIFVTANVPAEGGAPVEFMRSDLRERTIRNRELIVERTAGRTIGGLRPGEPPIRTELEVIDFGPRGGIEAPGPVFEPFSWAGVPRHLPRTYIRCLRDTLISPELVEVMLSNMGGARVVDIDAGHNVALTAPAELAAVLDSCAGS